MLTTHFFLSDCSLGGGVIILFHVRNTHILIIIIESAPGSHIEIFQSYCGSLLNFLQLLLPSLNYKPQNCLLTSAKDVITQHCSLGGSCTLHLGHLSRAVSQEYRVKSIILRFPHSYK